MGCKKFCQNEGNVEGIKFFESNLEKKNLRPETSKEIQFSVENVDGIRV